ncbi:hypothetical protein KEM48_008158 [Puccinia striiformis f. sp. tritici PST-130]|nr:hypothetical protein KEM48_008158 [Puccinia striiformis f. sp. tritici PST-130]
MHLAANNNQSQNIHCNVSPQRDQLEFYTHHPWLLRSFPPPHHFPITEHYTLVPIMAQARPTRIQHQVNPANSIDDSSSEYKGSDEISKGELGDKDSEAEACEDSEAGSADNHKECSNVESTHLYNVVHLYVHKFKNF